jgi:hypothetical protein
MKVAICLIIASLFLISCKNNEVTKKARDHTQQVVKNIYRDTVFTYLRSKYLPVDDTRELIEEFRERYTAGTLRGSLIHEQYYRNFSGNDEVTFLHQYKSEKKMVKIQMTYELIKDTFEVKSLVIHNSSIH